jgi:hypothetical protein
MEPLFLHRRGLTIILAAIAVSGAVAADDLMTPADGTPVEAEMAVGGGMTADDPSFTEQMPAESEAPAQEGPEMPTDSEAPSDPKSTPDPEAPSDPEATSDPEAPADQNGAEIGPMETSDEPEETTSPCREPVENAAATWLDKGNVGLYQAVCSSVAWFDGFFGTREYDRASAQTFGRVGLGAFWDERNGFDQSLRFRARYALPQLQERTSLLIGRGSERAAVKNDDAAPVDSIPSSFNTVEDDSFLVGLGYHRGSGIERGFDFSIGAKVRAPPEPYVKASYRRAWDVSARTLISAIPMVYWRYDEGIGATLGVSFDQLLTRRMMLRWSNSGNISQDNQVEGVEWVSRLSLFQQLTNRRALTHGLLLHGETKSEVPIRNYGYEFRYRQRILRKWLFLEFLSSVTWPQDFIWEERKANFGAGIGLEMYFGPIPDAQMR